MDRQYLRCLGQRGCRQPRDELVIRQSNQAGPTPLMSQFSTDTGRCIDGRTEESGCAGEVQEERAGPDRFPSRRKGRDTVLQLTMGGLRE